MVCKFDDGSSSCLGDQRLDDFKVRYSPNGMSLKFMNEWAVANINFVAAPCCVRKYRALRNYKNVDICIVLLISQCRTQGLLLGRLMVLVKAE